MALTQNQKNEIVTLLEQSVVFHTKLKDTLVYLASLEANGTEDRALRDVALSTRKQFYELSSYMKSLEAVLQKPDLRVVET